MTYATDTYDTTTFRGRDHVNTLSIGQVAALTRFGRSTCYVDAHSGELLGVRVLRVGGRYRVPLRPVADALGMTTEEVIEFLGTEGPPQSEPSGPGL